jgi:hypothetical protein
MPSDPPLSRRRHAPKGPIKQHLMEGVSPMEGAQCTATSKQSGQRCKRPAIAGGNVCYIHGGAAPHVKQAALDRLLALQDPAINRIEKLIDQEQFPSVSYAASKDVLDRTLGRATEVVEMTHSLDEQLLERLLRGRKRNGHHRE